MTNARLIPVLAGNRGLRMMIQAALTRMGWAPAFIDGPRALADGVTSKKAPAVLLWLEDLLSAQLGPRDIAQMIGPNVTAVYMLPQNLSVDIAGLRARTLRVPFSANDFMDVVGPEVTPRQATDDGVPNFPHTTKATEPTETMAVSEEYIRKVVDAEVVRQLEALVGSTVRELVNRMIPELAETMIRDELDRLLRSADESATADEDEDDS